MRSSSGGEEPHLPGRREIVSADGGRGADDGRLEGAVLRGGAQGGEEEGAHPRSEWESSGTETVDRIECGERSEAMEEVFFESEKLAGPADVAPADGARGSRWQRDYSSIEAYRRSLATMLYCVYVAEEGETP